MPRGKFIQTMVTSLVATCFAIAVALLAIYCCVQARAHSEPEHGPGTGGAGTSGTPATGASTATYNSSASAVAGIWLFVQIYLVNTMRARYPQLVMPGIVTCIFANVSMVYAPQFSTMAQGISFAKRLLEAFMTGFAFGTGVSLFVFPMTIRGVVFKEMTGYIMTLRGLMKANLAYLNSMEQSDLFARTPTGGPDAPPRSPEAQAIKDMLAGLAALHGKLSVDLKFAKREVAIGKLGPDDLQEIFNHLRGLFLPMVGLSSVNDVFERIAAERGWDHTNLDKSPEDISDPNERSRVEALQDWHNLSAMLRDPFTQMIGHIDQGFSHVLFTLQLAKPPKSKANTKSDVEAKGDQPAPGQDGFTKAFEQRVHTFKHKKHDLLQKYCELRGIEIGPDFFENPKNASFTAPDWYYKQTSTEVRQKYRRQLYLVLYMDFLIGSIAQAVLDFVHFADAKEASGKMSKKRLVVPGLKRTKKWIMASFSRKEDAYSDEQHGMNGDGARASNVYLGDAFHKRRDPEHLDPTNSWQRAGNHLRGVAHFLRSPESVFGFRVACATMCLAIIAFLRDTQTFYVTQRLFWSQIMVTISMTPSAGQSVFSFGLRIIGTCAAMVTSFIIYYIVDGHTAGVLVFFWFFVMWGFYIVLKYPKFVPVGMIFSVTNTLIIGYELQVGKIGIAVSESNGQAYYPLYELAPYRLATVCAGLFVAWVWTIFPYPISEHSQLRADLGSSLYLLANYYSVVHETVQNRIRGGDSKLYISEKDSPVQQLDKARLKVFAKSMLVLQGLRTHSSFVKFDFPIGGRFPKATYDKIIDRIQDILNFSSLISYASRTFADMEIHAGEDEASESTWLQDFRKVTKEANVTSRELTTVLALLSASVASGQPLPPYLKTPVPYALSAKLEAMDKDILSVRHMAEPGYAAFACMQIGTKCIGDDVAALLRDVKELVGELDFSFHAISTADSSASSSNEEFKKEK